MASRRRRESDPTAMVALALLWLLIVSVVVVGLIVALLIAHA